MVWTYLIEASQSRLQLVYRSVPATGLERFVYKQPLDEFKRFFFYVFFSDVELFAIHLFLAYAIAFGLCGGYFLQKARWSPLVIQDDIVASGKATWSRYRYCSRRILEPYSFEGRHFVLDLRMC